MSQLDAAKKQLKCGVNEAKTPQEVLRMARLWIDTMLATEWEFDDVKWAVNMVGSSFVTDVMQHKILMALCETDLDSLPNAMMIRCGYDETPKQHSPQLPTVPAA